jgi:nucleotide-binding universal stress UspA family protein
MLEMFSKILAPVDGSENSYRAVKAAIFLAQKIGSDVLVVHVLENLPKLYIESQKILNDLLAARTKEGRDILVSCLEEAKKSNVSIKTELLEGDAASIIVELSKKENFDAIFMGSQGLGRFKELFLGSVSSKVLHHARCLVLLVK